MTYRLLSASKDTYITDRFIVPSRSLDANAGQAGTLDLFYLFNETEIPGTSGSTVELSRLLIQFDYSEISTDDIADSSFTASLSLKDIYGGQTTPSNFTLVAFPLSKSFDEGRGFDVVAYRDIDAANFLSASTSLTWSISGAGALGTAGEDVDVIVSGNIGSGLQNLGAFQTFNRGDEDALFDITPVVSASVAGILPNNGFRISFIESQETDITTKFVKRFGARHTYNKSLHPKLIVEVNNRILDTAGDPAFNVAQKFFTYNSVNGNKNNFTSGSVEITGSNSLLLVLAASKSITFTTSSFQGNFSTSINHLTTSVVTFSQTFTASQYNDQTGIYFSDFTFDLTTNSALLDFMTTGSNVLELVDFHGQWKSLDETVVYSKDFFRFNKSLGAFNNADETNYVVNATNLKDEYTKNDEARIRVFVQDRNLTQPALRVPTRTQSSIIKDMRWRLKKAYEEDVVIPFSVSTKMSTDRDGMYFDLFIQDLDINEVYELEFLMTNDTGKDIVIQNKGFIFKVVK